MTQSEFDAAQIAQADKDRTSLQFVSFLSGLAGTPDQSMAGADGSAVSPPGQFQTITPYGTAIEGRAVSNQQGGLTLSPMLLLLIAVVAVVAINH